MKLFLEVLFVLGMIVEPFVIKYVFNKLMNSRTKRSVAVYSLWLALLVADYVSTVAIAAHYLVKHLS